jgi:fluoride exporter
MKTLWIGLAGAMGTIARYHLDGWVQERLRTGFPYGTLVVNLVGSFLIAFLMHLGLRTEVISPTTRIVVATGFIGGFTTYSTFNFETLRYLQDGAWTLGALNIVATLFGCLAAGVAGWVAARTLVGA